MTRSMTAQFTNVKKLFKRTESLRPQAKATETQK